MSWNQCTTVFYTLQRVTLHVSVWVEILILPIAYLKKSSRSTWACELKYPLGDNSDLVFSSRSTWACELKFISLLPFNGNIGHAPRERVSWNEISAFNCSFVKRHAPRERVSWNKMCMHPYSCDKCHAPRERVSWNCAFIQFLTISPTSRSTWACELKCLFYHIGITCRIVTLHVSVWVEIFPCNSYGIIFAQSRSTWACELKLFLNPFFHPFQSSRSTWACELK